MLYKLFILTLPLQENVFQEYLIVIRSKLVCWSYIREKKGKK
jgi:hypothetical protein